jgi:hypothetical protein
MPLTATECKNAKPKAKPYKLSDAAGMFLFMQPNGSRYWRMKYRYAGKEKVLALGIYPEVSLSDARERWDYARGLLAKGQDPALAKREQKRPTVEKSEQTFERVAREWHKKGSAEWSAGYADKMMDSREQNVFPFIGKRPIAEITPKEMLDALSKIDARGGPRPTVPTDPWSCETSLPAKRHARLKPRSDVRIAPSDRSCTERQRRWKRVLADRGVDARV